MQLHIRDVSKTHPDGVPALKDVTLTILLSRAHVAPVPPFRDGLLSGP
jgi:hypothetical protein